MSFLIQTDLKLLPSTIDVYKFSIILVNKLAIICITHSFLDPQELNEMSKYSDF